MSDGPHRSLQLRKHWRDVAERAARPAYVVADVAEALRRAVALDMSEAPADLVRHLLGVGEERSLVAGDPDAVAAELEQCRSHCRGSAAGNVLIDGAVATVRDSLAGDAAYEHALLYAHDAIAQSHSRSIEEHFQRKAGDRSARYMRDRLGAARALCDPANAARALANAGEPSLKRPPQLGKHTGLEDGPPL